MRTVGRDGGGLPVGPLHPALRIVGVDHREGGVRERQDERHLGPQHAVHLPEHPVDVLDGRQAHGREGAVDRVGPQEGQLGQRGVVQLDLHALAVGGGAGIGDLVGRLVDADDLRPLAGQRDGVVAAPAAEVEDALALHRAQQLEGVLAGHVGPVGDDVGGQVVPRRGSHREALVHAQPVCRAYFRSSSPLA